MTTQPGGEDDWRRAVVRGLRDAVGSWRGELRPLADELVDHFAAVLGRGDGSQVAAVSVPVAVFAGLRGTEPPRWLTAAAGATYLAWDLLDDDMDGDPVPFWGERSAADRTIGAHLLLATAVAQPALHADPAMAPELTRVYLTMVAAVTDGQLRAQAPLHVGTTPESVAAGNDARSGDMLAGLAELAAIAAGASAPARAALARFGRELALARQLVNDLTELESAGTSDLRNRTPTMIAAFAVQRTPAAGRAALIERLHAAAGDADLLGRMLDGELRPARADTRMLARIHLSEAARLANSTIDHPFGRMMIDSLVNYTAEVLIEPAPRRPR